jgi:voltage-gated potassium channel
VGAPDSERSKAAAGTAGEPQRRRRPHRPEPRSRLRERTANAIANRRVFPYLATVTALLAVGVGILVRMVVPKDFDSIGEGIWWAIVTLATVGYGDVVPTTPWGRVIGSIVIVCGVTFLAFLTATVTSMFVSNEQRRDEARLRETFDSRHEELRSMLVRIDERLDALEGELERGGRS